MRFILCVSIILSAGIALAVDLGPAQIQQIKQENAELLKSNTSLISSLSDANTKCNQVADASAKIASRQSAIDQTVAAAHKIPEAPKLLQSAIDLQTAFKAFLASSAGIKAACADQAKQLQAFSSDLSARTVSLGNLIQQADQNPAPATIATNVRNNLDGLGTTLQGAQKVADSAVKPVQQIQSSASLLQQKLKQYLSDVNDSKLDSSKIDELMKEAESKAKAAEDAATAEMIMGIVSSAAASTSATSAFTTQVTKHKDTIASFFKP